MEKNKTDDTKSTKTNKVKVVREKKKTDDNTQVRYMAVIRKAKGHNVYNSQMYKDKSKAEDYIKVNKKQGDIKASKIITIKL
ncbi:hypothetical protein [Carboxylicivirga sp. RSCT41]|uniref:hypothetical protein n=1 Tax=Carboxylicivirga agarovorans TaxID=3417570 RepID=UPI003D326581